MEIELWMLEPVYWLGLLGAMAAGIWALANIESWALRFGRREKNSPVVETRGITWPYSAGVERRTEAQICHPFHRDGGAGIHKQESYTWNTVLNASTLEDVCYDVEDQGPKTILLASPTHATRH